MTQSVEELRAETERNRAELAATVDRLKARIAVAAEDIRHKVSPQHVKSEVSEFISGKTRSWADGLKRQAMENPLQAIARRWWCISLYRASRGQRRCTGCTKM